ncbi:MAG: AAA family ATPase, partial [Anaerolineae bacterium]
MLRWRQMQAINDKLLGRGAAVPPGDLDEPWRTLYRQLEPVDDRLLAERALWKATEGLDDRHTLVETVLLGLPSAGAVSQFQPLDALAADLPPVEWVWPGWLPRGMLSLLGAAPGAGKSLVALDLARRVIHS